MIKISYIIPYYKGQKEIHHCLDSILSIGLPENEFEIIVIDDCSPISAETALSEYIIKNKNIHITRHKQNKRQGAAKNTGINLAHGEYIAFADQDDEIIAQKSQKALDFALKMNVDILTCNFKIRKENGELIDYGLQKGDRTIISGKDFCEQLFEPEYNLAPWSNLYKREFLHKVARYFEENVLMEDSDWIAWHYIHADVVGIFNSPIYTWAMNSYSITHSLHYVNRADWIKFGYRKIRDAQLYKKKSNIFAEIMTEDGKQNIIGGMKKLWKVDNYRLFYRHLDNTLPELQKMNWSGITKILINHPILTLAFLYPIGSIIKKIRHAKANIIK